MATPRKRSPIVIVGVTIVVLWTISEALRTFWLYPRPAVLTITGGSADAARQHVVERLADAALGRLELRPVTTHGSADALRAVRDGRLDLALVQGGLELGESAGVYQLAALQPEPLHLLIKPDVGWIDEKPPRLWTEALAGRRINIGEAGSGTHWLAPDVLTFAGLSPGEYEASTLSIEALRAIDSADAVPDAVFIVSALPAPIVRTLIDRWKLKLVALPFAEAYAISAADLAAEDRRRRAARSQPATRRIRRDHVYAATIPPFTYGVEQAEPAASVMTLGTRMLLVAGPRVPSGAVTELLDVVFAPPFNQFMQPPLTPRLLDLAPEYPLHPGAERYRDRNQPLIAADVLDQSEKFASIAGVLLGGAGAAVPGLLWLRRRRKARSAASFLHYMLRVNEIEKQVVRREGRATPKVRELLSLQRQLGEIKTEALDRFAAGELEGGEMLTGFLTLLNDAREYITRIILHERESIEQEAARLGKPFKELWEQITADPPAAAAGDPPAAPPRA